MQIGKKGSSYSHLRPVLSPVFALVLGSAVAIPLSAQQQAAQQGSSSAQTSQPAATQPASSNASSAPLNRDDKEGFWGHMNPFARKKWVNKRIDPLRDRLSELDEVNAKNSRDIQDVDQRAQAGIRKAQASADAANQTASAAGDQAQQANSTAQTASAHVNQLGETVEGLDQYKPITEMDVHFRGATPVLTADARKQLDDLAAGLAGHQGYIVEIEGHARGAGSVGIQNADRLNEAVKRYLVTEHQIPVYRMHAVALGNAKSADSGEQNAHARVTSTVHIRLMENSLAAQGPASPHGAASLNGAERP